MHLQNILSCFDGISCGQEALNQVGITFENYYASEIDKIPIKVTQQNHSKTIQLGDISDWKSWELENIDLIMGGSPCQGFSSIGKGLNFDDPRSKLFFTFVEIIKHFKPKYFLLENVNMKSEWRDIITDLMGVEPILINSNLVSAQNRPRWYWCNWTVTLPAHTGVKLSSILESDTNWMPAHIVGRKLHPITGKRDDYNPAITATQCLQVKKNPDKMGCLTTVSKDAVISSLPHGRYVNAYTALVKGRDWRDLTSIECERLQGLSDNYTSLASQSARRKMLGNGWNIPTIKHIFQQLKTSISD